MRREVLSVKVVNNSNNNNNNNNNNNILHSSGIFRQPPRGEKRYVYLDPSEGRFGFRLQVNWTIRGCYLINCQLMKIH